MRFQILANLAIKNGVCTPKLRYLDKELIDFGFKYCFGKLIRYAIKDFQNKLEMSKF